MFLVIRRIRTTGATVNWELTLAVVLTVLAAVLLVLWVVWLVAGDPTVYSYVEHNMLVRTSEFHGGLTGTTDLHNGWTAIPFGDHLAYSFPWLVSLTPVVVIASTFGAILCYRANSYSWGE